MPRKTDSNNPADWLFMAASDMEGIAELSQKEISYAMCRSKLAASGYVRAYASERGDRKIDEGGIASPRLVSGKNS